MKTIHLTSLGHDLLGANAICTTNQRHLKAPLPVRDQACLDALTRLCIIGTWDKDMAFIEDPASAQSIDVRDAGFTFFESSLDRGLQFSDPVGSVSVRIDYDPNWKGSAEFIQSALDGRGHASQLFEDFLFAVNFPHDPEKNAAPYVDHYRISAVLRPGFILSRDIFPIRPLEDLQTSIQWAFGSTTVANWADATSPDFMAKLPAPPGLRLFPFSSTVDKGDTDNTYRVNYGIVDLEAYQANGHCAGALKWIESHVAPHFADYKDGNVFPIFQTP